MEPAHSQPLEIANRRPRLSQAPTFAPWVMAPETSIAGSSLFWLPVSGFPLRLAEKQWLLLFLERFAAALTASQMLRCEQFMQQHEICGPLHHAYHAYKQHCIVYPGLGRFMSGGASLFPQDGAPSMTREPEMPERRLGRNLLWFANKQPVPQRELFLGYGGFLALFLPRDPKPMLRATSVPPITPALRAAHPALQRFDVEQIVSGTAARLESWLAQSKTLFAADLVSRAELRRMDFVLPLLDSASIFAAPPEERANWFECFDVYLGESRKDRGLVLFFQKPEYRQHLLDVLAAMPPSEAENRR